MLLFGHSAAEARGLFIKKPNLPLYSKPIQPKLHQRLDITPREVGDVKIGVRMVRAKQKGHCNLAARSECQHCIRQLPSLCMEVSGETLHRLLRREECLIRLLKTFKLGIPAHSALSDQISHQHASSVRRELRGRSGVVGHASVRGRVEAGHVTRSTFGSLVPSQSSAARSSL